MPLCCLAVCLLASAELLAGEWPQILGPQRNGQAEHERLLAQWPAEGPTQVWQCEVGSGFAGAAVAGGQVVLFHRVGAELVAEARDATHGAERWKVTFPTRYSSTISPDDGPRCVPLIAGDRVYLLGPGGELACVVAASGKIIWQRNICQEFKAPDGYFGAGSTPIVEGDKLLINVGGKGAGIVALSTVDGKTIWQATDELASYSSPVAVTIDGTRHMIFVTRLSVVSIDPATGSVRFRFPFGARGPTVNAANPVVLGDRVFVSANYGVGAVLATIERSNAAQVWASDDVMSSQYTTAVAKDDLLFGIDGRQDVGVARLRAFDPSTGMVAWTKDGFGTGNLILADGKLLALKTNGELALVDPSPKSFQLVARARLFDTTAQALAALSNGLLYARDTKSFKCVRVGSSAPKH
jgi:outer membrane protein assembly factor BamB